MKFSIFLLLFISCIASAKGSDGIDPISIPCLNIPNTAEVIACMIDLADSKKKEYTKEFNVYLKSINTPEERPYSKSTILKLASKAKKSWDTYTNNECLAEASIYEKDNYSYNDIYNSCLIKHYNDRIEYYKNNKY